MHDLPSINVPGAPIIALNFELNVWFPFLEQVPVWVCKFYHEDGVAKKKENVRSWLRLHVCRRFRPRIGVPWESSI